MPRRSALVTAAHELALPLAVLAALLAAAAGSPSPWPARAALALLAVQLGRLAAADADLTLLALGPAPRAAFAGQTVWVVGASQGLGEALALDAARRGARLVLSARRPAELARVAALCTAAGAASAACVPLDLRGGEPALVAAAAAAAAASPAGLSYLVLAAGGTQRSTAEETSGEVETDLFRLNVLSQVGLAKAALPSLRQGGGRIVVLASAAGKLASPGQAAYAASKHAVVGYFASLRTELAKEAVGVTLVCPGPVATGAPGQPRVTFGATLAASSLGGSAPGASTAPDASARLGVTRCAALTLDAAGHGVREAWLGRHPVLALLLVAQYAPSLAAGLLDKVGPKRVRAMREGGSMYALRP